MDVKKIALWAAGLGLATAIVTFATTTINTISTLKAKQAQSEQQINLLTANLQAETTRNQQLVEQARAQTANTAYMTEQLSASNARCSQYVGSLNNLESDFAALRAQNGTMLSMAKSCATAQDKAGCISAVCIGAAFFGADCVRTLNNAAQLSTTIQDTRSQALADNCQIASSPTLAFLNGN